MLQKCFRLTAAGALLSFGVAPLCAAELVVTGQAVNINIGLEGERFAVPGASMRLVETGGATPEDKSVFTDACQSTKRWTCRLRNALGRSFASKRENFASLRGVLEIGDSETDSIGVGTPWRPCCKRFRGVW
jgi:hypothetical protein